MPNFVSIRGKMFPAKESVSMTNTFGRTIESEFIIGPDGSHVAKEGEVFIYNGPDREAVKMLREQGLEYLGKDFKTDPEFLQSIRNMGFNDVDVYLKSIGYEEEKDTKKQEALLSIINRHLPPKEVDEIIVMGGGKDTTGNKENDIIGGFGDERIRKPDEITKTETRKRGRPKKE